MNKKSQPNNLSDLEGLQTYTNRKMIAAGSATLALGVGAFGAIAAISSGEGGSSKPENVPAHVQHIDVVQLAANPQDVIVEVGLPPVPPSTHNN